jgi:lipopolysaccharide biosynthesis protein
MNNVRYIAFYLPQYHPIPENDEWWGKGFTEWLNVAKAKPLFKGHFQPRIPTDLGFYDLRLPEVREEQANLAKYAGIEGFCYWHYWFGNGKRLLELPFNQVVESGKPDYPFCLCWANHTWSNKTWLNSKKAVQEQVLVEQQYLGDQDYIDHFNALLPAFQDKRYITVDGKPLFVVYNPIDIPDMDRFICLWRELAIQNGLKGIHFVGRTNNAAFRNAGEQGKGKYKLPTVDNAAEFYNSILEMGFDAVNSVGRLRAEILSKGRYGQVVKRVLKKFLDVDVLNLFDQSSINNHLFAPEDEWDNVYPTIYPNWDRSPRGGKSATIWTNSTPDEFKKILEKSEKLSSSKNDEHKIVFIQAWNEWGEGNYMEPDLQYGRGYIEKMHEAIYGK